MRMDTELMGARRVTFLEQYAVSGVVTPACIVADISRTTYLRWRKEDPEFNEACDAAFQCAIDTAELELRNRGITGTDEPVIYKGEIVWMRDPETGALLLDDRFEPRPLTVRSRSDRLLEVYLRAHRTAFREKGELAVTGANGGALQTAVVVRYVLPDGMTAADYETPTPTAEDSDGDDQQ